MRKTLVTVALLLAFCCPALAGEMHTPGSPTPPTDGVTINGEMGTPGVSDSLTQTALDLLAALSSLL